MRLAGPRIVGIVEIRGEDVLGLGAITPFGPDGDIATERGLAVEGGGGAAGFEPGYSRGQEALEHVLEGVVLLGGSTARLRSFHNGEPMIPIVYSSANFESRLLLNWLAVSRAS